jgi:aspartokinase
MESHQHVASKVYSALEDEKVSFFLISAQNKEMEIWVDNEEKNLLKRILKDYFKLVGAL